MTSRPPDQNPQPSSPSSTPSSPAQSRFRRLYDKLQSSLRRPRKFLSLLHPVIHHFLTKTLDYLSMDTILLSDDDDVSTHDRGFRSIWHSPEPEVEEEKLFFVPYRWWSEAKESLGESSEVNGVLYSAESSVSPSESMQMEGFGLNNEIVVNLRAVDVSGDDKSGSSEGDAYALLVEWMFLRALKWHNDTKGLGCFLATEDSGEDLFALEIRLFFHTESNFLLAKVCQKDNKLEAFRRAQDIFCTDSGLLSIWDFSGQTTQFLRHDRVEPSIGSGQLHKQILLELLVYGYSNFMKMQQKCEDEPAEESPIKCVFDSGPFKMIGAPDHDQSSNRVKYNSRMGLTGIYNLGNTCFMNSAIQCLVHTPKFVDYFLGDYRRDINAENPLGMNGELALAFGDLLRKLWSPGATPITPRVFKSKLAAFAPQFSGYNQHDSQEFLAFLLDGLHEDLNRVKCKPYIEAKDAEARPDDEVADEHWRNHLARNDSIIVDVCQGQYRSTLVCPTCKKSSVTFDPFMYLSLPLPSTTIRSMTLTVLRGDGTALPTQVTVSVPKYGTYDDLFQALSTACSLGDNEILMVAEIFNNRIYRDLDNASDNIDRVLDSDKLVAYILPKETEDSTLVVFIHEEAERKYLPKRFGIPLVSRTSNLYNQKQFGTPLVSRTSNISRGSDIRDLFLKLLNPFRMPVEEEEAAALNYDRQNNTDEDFEMEDYPAITILSDGNVDSDGESDDDSHLDFEFHLLGGLSSKGPKIPINEPMLISPSCRFIRILVSWPEKMMKLYDMGLLSSDLPKILPRQPQESVSLYKCLEAFLKEEPLGPEDMWYCPNCKKHEQASKKLDLWRLPEILIIHLKRFSYSRYMKNKLETLVDFPVDDLDLSNYVSCKSSQQQLSCRYMLYAISSHFGGLGGGHYTAFVQHGDNRWYEFDDSRVSPVGEDDIKTSAAYVLFYKRVTTDTSST